MLFILKAMTEVARIITRIRSKLARALCFRSARTSGRLQSLSLVAYTHGVKQHVALHKKHDAELEALRTKQAKVREMQRAASADLEASLITAANRAQEKANSYAMYIHG